MTVRFFKIKEPASKMTALIEVATQFFVAGEKLLIVTPNKIAADYIDHHLWKTPRSSFLPHQIVENKSRERIAIALSDTNWNDSKAIFNVCPTITPSWQTFALVYDLFDETTPEKTALSQEKLRIYSAQRAIEWVI